jgi:transposase-like protein
MDKITVTALATKISTEDEAYLFMEEMRWSNGITCPHCGSIAEHYFLNAKAPAGRKTRTGNVTQRRLWKCRECRKQFSVTTGTVMHGSKVSLRIWLFVIFEMCANKNGIAAREIERKYGVASRTAWFMTHRLREAMKRNANGPLFSGTIIADETWIGGTTKFMHHNRFAYDETGRRIPWDPKIPVVTLINEETGEARSEVVERVTAKNLGRIMNENVDKANSDLHTDGARVYEAFSWQFRNHEKVDHIAGEYVNANGASSNMAENYFSQLKRSLDGTHHHVSRGHLPRYLAEFDFRYTHCRESDTARMYRLMGRVGGKRLIYR